MSAGAWSPRSAKKARSDPGLFSFFRFLRLLCWPAPIPAHVSPVAIVGPLASVRAGHYAALVSPLGVINRLLAWVRRVRGRPALIAARGVVEARILPGQGRRSQGQSEEKGEERRFHGRPIAQAGEEEKTAQLKKSDKTIFCQIYLFTKQSF